MSSIQGTSAQFVWIQSTVHRTMVRRLSDVWYVICRTSYVRPRYVIHLTYHCWTLSYIGEGLGTLDGPLGMSDVRTMVCVT